MIQANLVDIYLDDDGDIAIGANGDLKIARDADVVAQEIRFRLKTVRGDYLVVPECGCDLELLIGEANSRQTAALMEAYVSQGLTHDNWLQGELKQIRAVPISREQLAAFIVVEYGDVSFQQSVTLDLKEGVL